MSDLTDGRLLMEYSLRGDEDAFSELVRRHGPAALRAVCKVVRDMSVAEDIVQASFMALVRNAASLDVERPLAGWINRVALHLALHELRQRKRRAAREENASMDACADGERPLVADEEVAVLYEEMASLSETYRVPLILHYMEGRSYADAASAVGCNVNTFGIRLTRAREKLRKRLIKRGLTGVTMGGLVAMLVDSASAAELPAGFVAATCAAAKGGAVSAKVAALTQSALKLLLWAKVQAVATLCAGVVLVGGAGVGVALTVPLVLHQDAAPVQVGDVSSGQPGTVWAWRTWESSERAPAPVNLADGTLFSDIMAVAAGPSHSVAVDSAGVAWAWGMNNTGQLGDGMTTARPNPARVRTADGSPFSGVTAVAVGQLHSVALKNDHTVWAWGSGFECGDATVKHRLYPARVAGVSDIRAIAACATHTLALKADGTVLEWGAIQAMYKRRPILVQQSGGGVLSDVIAISAGVNHSVALKKDGSVWTWGVNMSGALGNGGKTSGGSMVAVQVRVSDGSALCNVIAVAGGRDRTVALKSDNSVWVWGRFGRGTTSALNSAVPLRPASDVPLDGISAMAVEMDPYDILVLTRDGMCLGLTIEAIDTADDTMSSLRFTAIRVGSITGASAISTQSGSSLVVAYGEGR